MSNNDLSGFPESFYSDMEIDEIESFSVDMEVSIESTADSFDEQDLDSSSNGFLNFNDDVQSIPSTSFTSGSEEAELSSLSSDNLEFLLNDTRSGSGSDYEDGFDPATQSEQTDELQSDHPSGFFDSDNDLDLLEEFFDPETQSDLSYDSSLLMSPPHPGHTHDISISPVHENLTDDSTVDLGTPDNQDIIRCPICLLNIVGRFPSAFACGHMSCKLCIAGLITNNLMKCPVCRKEFQKSDIKRIYVA